MVGDLHIRIAKLAFHAKESPIWTREEVLVLIAKSLWNLPCMRQLSELAHEYTGMGGLGPI